jgi:hypothetical protein
LLTAGIVQSVGQETWYEVLIVDEDNQATKGWISRGVVSECSALAPTTTSTPKRTLTSTPKPIKQEQGDGGSCPSPMLLIAGTLVLIIGSGRQKS